MIIKGLIDEDFINYKEPCLMINTNTCSFKCDKECGREICQNEQLVNATSINIPTRNLVVRYLENNITKAVCFGGLEPFDQFSEILQFITLLREEYKCNDTVVIYTGYYKAEVEEEIGLLKRFGNIVVKFGRFIPDQKKHFDEILGVWLASPNQYAEKI